MIEWWLKGEHTYHNLPTWGGLIDLLREADLASLALRLENTVSSGEQIFNSLANSYEVSL